MLQVIKQFSTSLFRPKDLTLDLKSISGQNEKLGKITASFNLMPKTADDRQEVCIVNNIHTCIYSCIENVMKL